MVTPACYAFTTNWTGLKTIFKDIRLTDRVNYNGDYHDYDNIL